MAAVFFAKHTFVTVIYRDSLSSSDNVYDCYFRSDVGSGYWSGARHASWITSSLLRSLSSTIVSHVPYEPL